MEDDHNSAGPSVGRVICPRCGNIMATCSGPSRRALRPCFICLNEPGVAAAYWVESWPAQRGRRRKGVNNGE